MLRSLQSVEGLPVHATDGDIGKVHDFFFHDDTWLIRYLVVSTGHWLSGRKVLVSPQVVGAPSWEAHQVPVRLTREQVRASPDIDADKPVSRQQEVDLYQHYGWPAYWVDPGFGPWPSIMPVTQIPSPAPPEPERAKPRDRHLRSARRVRGYHLNARDGEIGHLEDFLVEVGLWVLRYLVVDTRNWWPGKQVLVSPQWLWDISEWERGVHVDLTRETIRSGPEFDRSVPVSREYEEQLYRYYGRSGYWNRDERGGRAEAA